MLLIQMPCLRTTGMRMVVGHSVSVSKGQALAWAGRAVRKNKASLVTVPVCLRSRGFSCLWTMPLPFVCPARRDICVNLLQACPGGFRGFHGLDVHDNPNQTGPEICFTFCSDRAISMQGVCWKSPSAFKGDNPNFCNLLANGCCLSTI